MPWMVMAPSITAVTASPGMPKAMRCEQGAADIGVVRGLRCNDALGVALAKTLRRFGEFLGLVIGHHARRTAADRGQDTDDQPDDGRPEQLERLPENLPVHLQMREALKLDPDQRFRCRTARQIQFLQV